jgi:two-component system, LytTR family, sensor kinase
MPMQPAPLFWNKVIFWGIRRWELLAFASLHIFLGFLYWLAVLLSSGGQNQAIGITLNYLYKMLLTAPLWWLFFCRLRHWPLQRKLWLHLPACALYVAAWLGLFYATVDALKIGRLKGTGVWWDVYIPTLVYFIQFGIFHAYGYWCETLRQKETEKALLRLAHSAEMAMLKAQIQPHFLFNTLNSISASVPAAQEHTRTLIARLADVFRFAMNVSDKELIPLGSEMVFIQNFLALEQQRFGDRLQVHFDFDVQLADYAVPPMLLQPLVENAVKHGIANSVEGGSVSVSVRSTAGAVLFRVLDTGKGINGTPQEAIFSKGIGLKNIRQRLLRLYGTSLEILPNEPHGFCVTFSLPQTSLHA